MEIRIAKHAGFCFGVRRAIQIAEEVAQKTQQPTYVPGELVHNEVVISDLKKKGIVFLDSVKDVPSEAVTVLRAHGEPKATYEYLRQKNVDGKNLTDATCPLVTLVHNVAKQLKKEGYEIIIFGKFDHPETIGTRSHIKGDDTFVVEHPEDYPQLITYLTAHNFPRVALISQTTMSVFGYRQLIENLNAHYDKVFEEIPLHLKDFSKNFGYVDTICQPTKLRQSDTEDIAKISDLMIVVGGKNSSNAKELARTSEKYGVETYYIQTPEQLRPEWFIGKKNVGVSAGASTPDSSIQKVVQRIKDITNAGDDI